MNEVFVHHSKEGKIYPPTAEEIAESQRVDASLKYLFKRNAVIDVKLPENRQSETSLGKVVNGGRISILHVEGFQASKQIPRTHN